MGGYYYETKQGDMWDYIAWIVYGDETKAELLLSAPENRQILTEYIFSAGVKVWCPAFEGDAADDLPPWRNE